MNEPFFSDPARAAALVEALGAWEGTPFVQGHAVRGAGVDCVRLVREVYRAAGADVALAERIPSYSLNWGRLHAHSALLGWFREDAGVRRALRSLSADAPPMPGDLWAVRGARAAHHLGVLAPTGDRPECAFWHVPIHGTVHAVPLPQIAACAKVAARWRYCPPPC